MNPRPPESTTTEAPNDMSAFNRLPGFTPSPPGLEHRIWRRLPAALLWGTLLPLVLVGLNHALAPGAAVPGVADGAQLRWDFTLLGIITLHWTMVLTLGLGCFIVRVMKGPAYVADAYAMPQAADENEGNERPSRQAGACPK